MEEDEQLSDLQKLMIYLMVCVQHEYTCTSTCAPDSHLMTIAVTKEIPILTLEIQSWK